MAENVLAKIQELSSERDDLLALEGKHHRSAENTRRLEDLDHQLKVLWDLRRRELAGESVSLEEDFYDDYDRYGGRERRPESSD